MTRDSPSAPERPKLKIQEALRYLPRRVARETAKADICAQGSGKIAPHPCVVSEALNPEWSLDQAPDCAPVAPSKPDFDTIYERWFHEVTRWVRALGGPHADQEDLVQDVFLVAHRRLKDFDGSNVGGWLYQIARRRVRDHRRLRWVKSVLLRQAPVSDRAPIKGPGPADSFETKEKQRVLEHLLEKLNQTERAAIVLFEVEGYSGQEIARIQGVPLNTVWARIHKARKKLRVELDRVNNGPPRTQPPRTRPISK
jgi:RNA polymerase sigma-70 factor (ECF subfamily)